MCAPLEVEHPWPPADTIRGLFPPPPPPSPMAWRDVVELLLEDRLDVPEYGYGLSFEDRTEL